MIDTDAHPPHRTSRVLLYGLLAGAMLGTHAGLEVEGIVVLAGTESPIAGALVSVVDNSGAVLGRTVTGTNGRFRLDPMTRGATFSLQIEAVGIQAHTAGPFSADDELHVELPGIRVDIGALPDAADASQCVVRPPAGTAAGILWAEARKALRVEAWTRSVNHFSYNVFQYERRLDESDRISMERSRRLEDIVGAASRSRPAAELAEQGYARSTARGEILYAPDVDVLLSAEFADGHCFRVVREGVGASAIVGLAFAPASDREVVDIEGIFWMNPSTGGLMSLEFRFTNLEERGSQARASGGIEFMRLPGDLWTVGRWFVRTPMPGATGRFREEGVEVMSIASADGFMHSVIGRAGVIGTVRDRAGGRPLAGADIELAGTDYSATSNADGRFFIPELPPGRYSISFAVTIDGVERKSAPRDLWLGASQTTVVELELVGPNPRSTLQAQAPTAADSIRFYLQSLGIRTTQRVDSLIYDALAAKAEGRLIGRVLDQSTGRPISGVVLSLPGTEWTALTEDDGRFVMGDIPAGRYVLRSQMIGYGERMDTLEVPPGLIIEAQVGMATEAIELEPISVTVLSRWLDQHGFYNRRSAGLAGHFFTREDIEKRSLSQFTELFRDVPGVNIIHAQPGMTSIRFNRLHSMTVSEADAVRGCEPAVYYDGIPMNTSIDRLDMIAVPFVEGVEVYVGAATPLAYQHPCGVILVWTRRPR